MAMPTSRRKRFRFYRLRQLRRLRRLESRRRRGATHQRRRYTRERDASLLLKQWPRPVHPWHVQAVLVPRPGYPATLTGPAEGGWLWVDKGYAGRDRGDAGNLRYVDNPMWHWRRVKHVPRLHHLPVKPYSGPARANYDPWWFLLQQAGVNPFAGGHSAPRRPLKWRPPPLDLDPER